jgi:hypothetical protein
VREAVTRFFSSFFRHVSSGTMFPVVVMSEKEVVMKGGRWNDDDPETT